MRRLVVLGLVLAIAAPVSAGESQPIARRFAFVPVATGALRLDVDTGEVSLCVGGRTAPSCTRVAKNIRLTVGERAKLEARIAELETRVAAIEARSRDAAAPAAGEKAMDRVKLLAARLVRHFVGAVHAMK